GAGLPGFEQRFAVFIGSQFPEPAHALDFVMCQRRKRLLVTWKSEGRAGRRTGRDVCTHDRYPKKKQEPCREHARQPASDRDRSLSATGPALLRWRHLGRRRRFRKV